MALNLVWLAFFQAAFVTGFKIAMGLIGMMMGVGRQRLCKNGAETKIA